VCVLKKPFEVDQLIKAVRRCIASGATASES
jgi:hypothetical protein